MGAANAGGVLEFDGSALEDFGESDDSGADNGGGLLKLEGLCGVDDVGGGESVVEPARGYRVCDVLGDGGGEGDDVVADFRFDLVDAGDGEVALVADGVGGGLWTRPNLASACEAATSTVSQQRYLFSSDQILPIAGRV